MKTKLLFVFLLYGTVSGAQIPLSDSLQACYSFTGSASDESGNGNHGFLNNVLLTSDRFANPNSAFSYNGSNAYISLPNDSFLNLNYTYSVWVKLNAIPPFGTSRYVISIGSSAGDQAISIQNNSNWIGWSSAGWDNGGSSATQSVTGILPAIETWYHLVAVRSNTARMLYVDGVLIDSASAVGTPYYGVGATKKATIGDRSVSGNFKFNGVIDDLRIYKRALNSDEITMLYVLGQELLCSNSSSINDKIIDLNLNLYPNPFATSTTLSVNMPLENATLTMFNSFGQIVRKYERLSGEEIIINRDDLANGIYFFMLHQNEKLIATKKAIVLY